MSIDLYAIKREILIKLRNELTDTHSPSRTTDRTEYFSGDNSTKIFELTKDISRNGNHLVKNVKTVTVNGVALSEYTDWTFKYQGTDNGKITFTTAPDNASSDNIVLTYSFGLAWIFTDLPRTEITPKNCPRISIELLSAPSAEIALGAEVLKTPMSISMTIIANKTYDLDVLTKQVRDAILDNRTSFHNINLITEPRMSPTIISGDPEAYMFQRTIDWTIPNNYEFYEDC